MRATFNKIGVFAVIFFFFFGGGGGVAINIVQSTIDNIHRFIYNVKRTYKYLLYDLKINIF